MLQLYLPFKLYISLLCSSYIGVCISSSNMVLTSGSLCFFCLEPCSSPHSAFFVWITLCSRQGIAGCHKDINSNLQEIQHSKSAFLICFTVSPVMVFLIVKPSSWPSGNLGSLCLHGSPALWVLGDAPFQWCRGKGENEESLNQAWRIYGTNPNYKGNGNSSLFVYPIGSRHRSLCHRTH